MWVFGGTLIPDSSELAGVRAVAAADPQFRLDDFLEFARTEHRNLHPGAVTEHVHTAIIEATHADKDVLLVRFGAVIDGKQTVEDWEFERSATAYAHLQGVFPQACSSCGSGLSVDQNGNCQYCGTHVVGVAGPWTLTAVSPLRRLGMPETKGSLTALDPAFPVADFLAFARTVYLNVHRATLTSEVGAVGNVLTTEMRSYLQSRPDELAWAVPIDAVSRLDVVDVQRGALDTVTVRFEAVSEGMEFVEDWVFERPAALGTRPDPTSCSFCGAALQLDEDGNCPYCATHLLDIEGDWRLARAQQPRRPMATHPVIVNAMQSKRGQVLLLLIVVATFVAAVVAIMLLALQ